MLVQAPDTTRVFDRIVCGVDSSPESLEAARQADRLRSLAPIVAVNVIGGPVELERPRGRRPLGEPRDHLRSRLPGRSPGHAGTGAPRVQRLPGGGASV
jgi:hypothetical protein